MKKASLLTSSTIILTILFLSCGQSKQQKIEHKIETEDLTQSILSMKNNVNFNSEDPTQTIPKTLIEFIQLNLSSLKIPSITEYKSTWKIFKDNNYPPFYCSNYFNGDGKRDFCLLLLNDSSKLDLYAFITEENGFKPVFIDRLEKNQDSIEVSIEIETKGLWKNEADEEKVNITSDGIYVHFFEESLSKAYYWHDGKFQRFVFE